MATHEQRPLADQSLRSLASENSPNHDPGTATLTREPPEPPPGSRPCLSSARIGTAPRLSANPVQRAIASSVIAAPNRSMGQRPALGPEVVSLLLVRETGSELLDAGRSLPARSTGRLGLSLPSTCEAPTWADRRADPSGAALRLWRGGGQWSLCPAVLLSRRRRYCSVRSRCSVPGAAASSRAGGSGLR
jgi:hypothetical protein